MFNTSFIEINEQALRTNLAFIRELIGEECTLSSVVKGNAYGHGITEYVPLAEKCGVRHFSVSNAQEAFEVHQAKTENSAIMIMGMIDDEQLSWAIKNDIEFYIFETERLVKAIEYAKLLGKPCKIHLEVETGMNRTGLSSSELKLTAGLIKQHRAHIEVKGICTHYSGAESIGNYLRIKKQITNFNRIRKWCERNGLDPQFTHSACSAAIVNYPSTIRDMVRVGIMQYGFWPSKETLIRYLSRRGNNDSPLKRLISWKSKVMSVKNVAAGEFVGYGTTFLAENDMVIATVPIGYADGYSRSLSNIGRVLINEVRVSVIGIVNMNMIVVDITNVPQTKKGDEVVMIGEQAKLSISVASFGELSNQLNYELLTRLPHYIPREVV